MRKFRKYTATALVAMMVAGMTMSGYQPADVSARQESEYIIVTKDKKSMKTVESKYNTMIDTQEQNTDFLKDENVLVSKMTAKEADIVIVAAGRAGVVGAEYVREGQTIIDVGINVNAEGKLCGDVDYAAVEPIVDAITPVPGGVGSVTTSVLVGHVVEAAMRKVNG